MKRAWIVLVGSLLACNGAQREDAEQSTAPTSIGDVTDTDTDSGTDTAEDTEEEATSAGEVRLSRLDVEPRNSVIELDIGEWTNLELILTGFYTDGTTVDLSGDATWSVDDETIGSVDAGVLAIAARDEQFFGSTLLTATLDDRDVQAQVTVAVYRKSGPQQDFFFVLPFEDDDGPQNAELTFETGVKALDVFFNVDTTGSMGAPISNLQSSLTTVVGLIQAQVPNTQIGVGAFEDFPDGQFGDTACAGGPDQPFELLQGMTESLPMAQAAVNALAPGGVPIGCGGDGPESNVEALYQIATGEGLAAPAPTSVAPNMDGIGGVGFREGALPIIVSITDAVSHDIDDPTCGRGYTGAVAASAHGSTAMFSALEGICARVVSVAVGNLAPSCSPLEDGETYARGTGSVIPPTAWDAAPTGRPPGCTPGMCCTGQSGASVVPGADGQCPLVYQADIFGGGLDGSIINGVQMLASYAPFGVTNEVTGVDADTEGEPLPNGTTTADFIKAVTPVGHGPVPVPDVPDPVPNETGFDGVVPDTDVTFDVEAFNDFVEQESQPRLFTANIAVLADNCGDLDERDVFILVPPEELAPPAG